jgi:hypothetical protein
VVKLCPCAPLRLTEHRWGGSGHLTGEVNLPGRGFSFLSRCGGRGKSFVWCLHRDSVCRENHEWQQNTFSYFKDRLSSQHEVFFYWVVPCVKEDFAIYFLLGRTLPSQSSQSQISEVKINKNLNIRCCACDPPPGTETLAFCPQTTLDSA